MNNKTESGLRVAKIQLHTNRLLIRDHIASDLASHHELLSDKETMRYMQDVVTHSIEESKANLQTAMEKIGHADRKYYFFRIEDKQTKEHIGEIGYTVLDFTPAGKHVELGYFLRRKFWGQGYATEAVEAVIKFAFEENNVYRITCTCLKENIASEKVMQKSGMTKEGDFKDYQWHEGELKDRVFYRLLLHQTPSNVQGSGL